MPCKSPQHLWTMLWQNSCGVLSPTDSEILFFHFHHILQTSERGNRIKRKFWENEKEETVEREQRNIWLVIIGWALDSECGLEREKRIHEEEKQERSLGREEGRARLVFVCLGIYQK